MASSQSRPDDCIQYWILVIRPQIWYQQAKIKVWNYIFACWPHIWGLMTKIPYYRIVWPRRRFWGIDCPIRSTGTKVIAVYVVEEMAAQLFDVCIIWLSDCAFIPVLRLVCKERWRAGSACLRPSPVPIRLQFIFHCGATKQNKSLGYSCEFGLFFHFLSVYIFNNRHDVQNTLFEISQFKVLMLISIALICVIFANNEKMSPMVHFCLKW